MHYVTHSLQHVTIEGRVAISTKPDHVLIIIILIIIVRIIFMVLSSWQSTSRVHLSHMMNVEWRQAGANPQHRPTDPGCESACRLPLGCLKPHPLFGGRTEQKLIENIALVCVFVRPRVLT